MDKKIKVGIYGSYGHQIHGKLYDNKYAYIGALCNVPDEYIQLVRENCKTEFAVYNTLEELLADSSIELISLCSPSRDTQADDAIKCLNAGKHVYAEKPAAYSEAKLDEILLEADKCGVEFHEMADSIFAEPYYTAAKIVKSGKIGEVAQVYVQKSYPLNIKVRPQNEYKDGGLIRQAGIHAMRFIEHITGLKVEDVRVCRTHIGNTDTESGLYTASSWMMTLNNGGVASACINYLNPAGFGLWGNETVRIFGTGGMLEITDGARHTHIYTDTDEGEIDISASDCRDFFDLVARHLLQGTPLPMSQEDELHPLRVVIRAFDNSVN